jgi:ribonuclease HI
VSRAQRASLRRLILFTDGAARGNPGPAGAGVCVLDASGKEVAHIRRYLGDATNNVAEYSALVVGLERARELGAREVEVRSDSELLVRQMIGKYRVRNENLREFFERAKQLEASFERVEYTHVPRDENVVADRLANEAIDAPDEA